MLAVFADDVIGTEEAEEEAEEDAKEASPYTVFWIIAAVLLIAFIIFCLWPDVCEIGKTFADGDYKTRLSFVIFGFGQIMRKQFLQGFAFLILEAGLLYYFFGFGIGYLKDIGTLGTVARGYNEDGTISQGENSFLILLFSLLTIFAIFAFILLWRLNVKENYKEQALLERGKTLPGIKGTWKALFDENFDKLLLAFPVIGIFVFIVLPIVFMICVAFTNYDKEHQAPANLFTWVGLQNFKDMFSTTVGGYGPTFAKVLIWTLVWAFFATFLNYFLGMAVAILINRKGIKLKKLWRTILVMTIAIPQFVSLLYVYKMFAADGLINNYLIKWGWIETYIPFWEDPRLAQIMIIIINLWIGIPYLMLIATGLLMNIPEDLYESARIDGANSWQQFYKITLPYMLFVTGPYLLTSFIGNLNNFNVIFLLTRGKPQSMALTGNAGYTDLLVTWLYKMTVDDTNYRLAAVIGIMVFVITAVISLVVYGFLPSVKDEEGFQ
ncbi:MAG: sugar ABC transporter permease [Lachnospiraceae bacterium]|nr:sugar ABC transporter permease [Lachnospiraceae bacterium]